MRGTGRLALLLLAGFGLYEWRRWATPAVALSPAPPPPARQVRISILVPAWNAVADLPAFMATYIGLSWGDRQLILCVGGDDGSVTLARHYATRDVVVLEQMPGEGKQHALERCLDASDGDVIVLTDIDCRLTDAVLQNLLGTLQQSGTAAVSGASRPLAEQAHLPLVRSHYATERATLPTEAVPIQGLLGRSAAIHREVLESTRALTVPAMSGTDYTLAKTLLRAGHQITFAPGHEIESEYPGGLRTYAHKQARWLRNVYLLGRRYDADAEVMAVKRTLTVSYALVLTSAAGLWFRPLAVLPLLAVVHAAVTRTRFQRSAGLKPSLIGSLLHVIADQWAALKATRDIILNQTPW